MNTPPAEYFERLTEFARTDPDGLGLAVTGSRAAGFEVPQSDYDCALFVRDERLLEVQERLEEPVEGIDLSLFTPSSFADHARWGSATAWDRYAWFIADFLVDRTDGELVRAAREKGRVPQPHVESHIDASLDWYLNQVARSVRCWTRGDEAAGRLEAAESVRPFLQAAFALHDRRLVPYYKFLAWEIERRPLDRFELERGEFVEAVTSLVTDGSPSAQQRVLAHAEAVFRAAGYARRFEEWETGTWSERYFGGKP